MGAPLSRRTFLKAAVGSIGVASGISRIPGVSAEAVDHHSILYNGFKCTGCELCQQGCKMRNGLPRPFETKLSPSTYLYVSVGAADEKEVKMRYSCMHCHDAACLNACPVSAIKRSKTGFVHIDPSHCIGCEYCVVACTYGVPRFDHKRGISTKCTGCWDLTEKGMAPACVQTCPWNALHYGRREEMISMAKEIKAEHPDAHIYGLEERGGLNVIYVLPVDPTEQGLLPRVSTTSKPLYPDIFTIGPLGIVSTTIIAMAAVAKFVPKGGEKK
ncbi:MAG: 4Fe-4S dicluster domain-containing protein [Euryarchaeota archaeon]|nr:4Fe-4S dicluster domain-containing protein [Euryarchaeota archaeon]